MSSLEQAISTAHQDMAERSVRDSATEITPDVTLDVSGLMCPLPGIKMVGAIRKLEHGQVLEVRSTNPMVRKFAPTMLKQGGNDVLATADGDDGFFRLFVRKA